MQMYRRALESDDCSFEAMVGLATMLIQQPGRSAEDMQQALKLVTEARQLTGEKNPAVLVAQADVCAAAGKVDDAVSAAQAALKVAQQAHDQNLASTILTRLQMYKRMVSPH